MEPCRTATGEISCPPTLLAGVHRGQPGHAHRVALLGLDVRGWSGACSGTGSCQVTMSDDMQVTATFTAAPSARRADAGSHRRAVGGDRLRRGLLGLGESGRPGHDGLSSSTASTSATARPAPRAELHRADASPSRSAPTSRSTASVRWPCRASCRTRSITCASSPPTARARRSGRTSRSRPPSRRPPAPPTLGKTFNIAPVSGLVLVSGPRPSRAADPAPADRAGRDDRHAPRDARADHGRRRWRRAHDAAAKGKEADADRPVRRRGHPHPSDQARAEPRA